MKTCKHCEGELLRHGVTHYKRDTNAVGIRYKCRECGRTFTVRIPKQYVCHDPIRFNQTGRPQIRDWRMIDIPEARQ